MDLVLINSIVILLYYFWWQNTLKATRYDPPSPENQIISSAIEHPQPINGCSIVVAFRNEASRIAPLLQSALELGTQFSWEIIFINDFSTDNSCEIVQQWMQEHPEIPAKLIQANKTSKKQCILQGILQAQYDWILTTDADCKLPSQLIHSHSQIIAKFPETKCIIGRVEFFSASTKYNLRTEYETLENQVLVAISLSAIRPKSTSTLTKSVPLNNEQIHTENKQPRHITSNAPIAANGANLFFHKATWLQLGGIQSHQHIASGDDIFTAKLFHQNNPSSLQINNHRDAVVKAQLCENSTQFIQQRIRWFKKSFLQNSQKTLFQQAFFGFYLLSLWVLTAAAVYGDYAFLFFLPIFAKAALDTAFGHSLLRYHRYSFRIPNLWLASLLQTLWLPILGLLAPWLHYQWKARKINR